MIAGPWQPGQVVTIQLAVELDSPIVVEARLAHRNRLYCGFQFLGVNDAVAAQVRTACGQA